MAVGERRARNTQEPLRRSGRSRARPRWRCFPPGSGSPAPQPPDRKWKVGKLLVLRASARNPSLKSLERQLCCRSPTQRLVSQVHYGSALPAHIIDCARFSTLTILTSLLFHLPIVVSLLPPALFSNAPLLIFSPPVFLTVLSRCTSHSLSLMFYL